RWDTPTTTTMPSPALPPATEALQGADDADGSGFFHGLFGGSGGGRGSSASTGSELESIRKGGPGGVAMKPPPAKPSSVAYDDKKDAAKKAMREESGEGAVAAAKEIGKLKSADVVNKNRVSTSTKHVMGRDFVYANGF